MHCNQGMDVHNTQIDKVRTTQPAVRCRNALKASLPPLMLRPDAPSSCIALSCCRMHASATENARSAIWLSMRFRICTVDDREFPDFWVESETSRAEVGVARRGDAPVGLLLEVEDIRATGT